MRITRVCIRTRKKKFSFHFFSYSVRKSDANSHFGYCVFHGIYRTSWYVVYEVSSSSSFVVHRAYTFIRFYYELHTLLFCCFFFSPTVFANIFMCLQTHSFHCRFFLCIFTFIFFFCCCCCFC